MVKPIGKDYFAADTLDVARDLVGKWLVHDIGRTRLVARIVETEAYRGDEPACHAWVRGKSGQPSPRGAALFGAPGTAYVYFNYGMHWLLNVITEPAGVAAAVLIRAVEPIEGLATMRRRRCGITDDVRLTNGPGKLTKAMGIDVRYHGTPLVAPPLFFAEPTDRRQVSETEIATSARIGITKGVELPWRFFAVGNPYVSRGKPNAVGPLLRSQQAMHE